MRLLFFLMSILCFNIFAQEEVVVPLATQSKLHPLAYRFVPTQEFNSQFLEKLQNVIKFDLNHNGYTQIVDSESAPYAIQFKIENQKLFAICVDNKRKLKTTLGGTPLFGEIDKDRIQVHKLSDGICKALFNQQGIASCKFIYTIKKKVGSKVIAEVYESDYDGANKRQITHEDALCVTPTYVPAKKGYLPDQFLYVSYRNGQPKIYIASLKTGESERVIDLKGNQFMPIVSLQRKSMAFISDITGHADLFLQPFDQEGQILGKPRQIFTAPRGTQASPSFSPDGKKIAFVSNKDGAPRIYLMDIPHSGCDVKDLKPQLISKHNRENTSPSWSADGKKIAYSSMTGGVRQIWVYDLDTQEEFQVTVGNDHKENPSWAPNSLHLLYNTANNECAEIYLAHLNGQEAVKITSGTGEKRFASWQPLVK